MDISTSTFHHLTKDSVAVIQMRGGSMCDKELRAIGPGSGIRHGEDALLIVSQAGMEFILKFVAGTAASRCLWDRRPVP